MARENGEIAQLVRASALHAEGQQFESVFLHFHMARTIEPGRFYDLEIL